MDIFDALAMWNNMGNTTEDRTTENGVYIINFMKDGVVVGWIKTYPGQGIRWNYPEELMTQMA